MRGDPVEIPVSRSARLNDPTTPYIGRRSALGDVGEWLKPTLC